MGIKVNIKRHADRLYVDADSTWLLWQGRRRPNTCTMVAYNGQEYMATVSSCSNCPPCEPHLAAHGLVKT